MPSSTNLVRNSKIALVAVPLVLLLYAVNLYYLHARGLLSKAPLAIIIGLLLIVRGPVIIFKAIRNIRTTPST